jgi:hypothetical protein
LLFVYPINGIDLQKYKELKIGNVTFIDKSIAIQNYNCTDYNYPVDSYAVVNLKNQTFNKTYNNGLNSIALKILKETIGLLNVSLYAPYNMYTERKITISNINKHFLEEGLIKYLTLHKNNVIIQNVKFDNVKLTMTDDELKSLEYIHKNWISLVSLDFEKRNEYQKKLLKALEYIYYISNEIYASERIIKYFIVLNNIFKAEGREINRQGIAHYLNIIFNKVKVVKIFDGNFNKEFGDLYDTIRNNIMHGVLDLDNEEGLINNDDFYNLKALFYELIRILAENENLNLQNSTVELNDYLDKLIKSQSDN